MRLFWKTPSIFAKEQLKEDKEKIRRVYLPSKRSWFDFWTGETIEGGQTIKADAPIEKLPLYIKAGSIIPLGPFLQYSTEKPADPIELRIYPGANGSFILYEDENDNYNYEKGIYSTIKFEWDEAQCQLKIANRKGEFPGMLKERMFHVVLVKENHGIGVEITERSDKIVRYYGKEIVIKFNHE
jgi:alpha-D-xyloside xylohydrolase